MLRPSCALPSHICYGIGQNGYGYNENLFVWHRRILRRDCYVKEGRSRSVVARIVHVIFSSRSLGCAHVESTRSMHPALCSGWWPYTALYNKPPSNQKAVRIGILPFAPAEREITDPEDVACEDPVNTVLLMSPVRMLNARMFDTPDTINGSGDEPAIEAPVLARERRPRTL